MRWAAAESKRMREPGHVVSGQRPGVWQWRGGHRASARSYPRPGSSGTKRSCSGGRSAVPVDK